MSRETLLLVEDNEALRRLYRTALRVAGYRVAEAANGLDALRKIDQEHPDAIVLDLHLPEVSGLAVLQDLRQQVKARSIPVIVVTGLPMALDGLDADCILHKPVHPDVLVLTVQRCIAGRPGDS